MSASNQCKTPTDCFEAIPDGVARHCYGKVTFSDLENFCDCSNIIGWAGESCDDESVQLNANRIMAMPHLFVNTFILLIYLRLFFNVALERCRNKTPVPTIIVTAFLLFTSTAFALWRNVITNTLLFTPEATEVYVYRFPTYEQVDGNVGGSSSRLPDLFVITFVSAALLHVVLTWFNLLKQTSHYFPEVLTGKDKLIKNLMLGLIIIFFLVIILSLALDTQLFARAFIFIISFVVVIFYVYFAHNFRKVVNEAVSGSQRSNPNSKNAEKQANEDDCLALVKTSFIWTGFLSIVSFLASVSGSVLEELALTTVKPGDWNHSTAILQIGAIFFGAVQIHLIWFVHVVYYRRSVNTENGTMTRSY